MKPSIGTISHGTLRTRDLLDAFANELAHLIGDGDANPGDRDIIRKACAVLTPESGGWDDVCDDDRAVELVYELSDALNGHALDGMYFGAHEGDGSDFGFWPSEDTLAEMPKFNDLADVPADMQESYLVVSDHGNISVYSADGALQWDCV